jgi:predicted DNA-binding antitoxin AbrB/MazE fold protein
MQETISAIYGDGVLLPLEDVFLKDHSPQKVSHLEFELAWDKLFSAYAIIHP